MRYCDWLQVHFAGTIHHKPFTKSEDKLTIYQTISIAVKLGFSFDDLSKINYVTLINLINAAIADEESSDDDFRKMMGG